jgi:hypothetical protein
VVCLGFDTSHTDDSTFGPLSVHRYWGVCVRLYPGSLVSGEGADATPEGSTGGARGARDLLEAMVISFGSPRWWQRWALLYSAGNADMAADAAGHTSLPLCWVDFRDDPDMVLPPGEVFDHRGMFVFFICFDLCYFLIYQFICMMIDTDTIVCWLFCACAYLAPRGREVEFQRAPT